MMEQSTLIWVGQTLFYILSFFLVLLVSKSFFKLRFKGVTIDQELTVKDNPSFTALTVGYFLGVMIIFLGVLQGDTYGYLIDGALILGYCVLGNVLLILSSLFYEKVFFGKKLRLHKEIFRDENVGAGFVEAANFIGSALIIYGAVAGQSANFLPSMGQAGLFLSGVISLLGLWLVGQLLLFLFLKAYTRWSPYRVLEQLEKDNNAVGIVYGSVFVAVAYLYGQAVKADFESWALTLENLLYYLGLGLLLLPLSRWLIDKIILPKSNLMHEIVRQDIPNKGAAFIEALAYIGSAILISYCI